LGTPNLDVAMGTGVFSTGVKEPPPFGCRYRNLTFSHTRRGTPSATVSPVESVQYGGNLDCTGGARIDQMQVSLEDRSNGTGTGRVLATGNPVSNTTAGYSGGTIDLPYSRYPEGRLLAVVISFRAIAPPRRVWKQLSNTTCNPEHGHIVWQCDGFGTNVLNVGASTDSRDGGVEQQQCAEDHRTLEAPLVLRIEPHLRWCYWSKRPDSPGWESGYVTSATRIQPTDVARINVAVCDMKFLPPGDVNPSPDSGTSVRFRVTVSYRYPVCEGPVVGELFMTVDRTYQATSLPIDNDNPIH
jgi:hypothetical protein